MDISVMKYLDNRAFNYTTKRLNVSGVNRFVSKEQYSAILRRVRLVSEEISSAMSFLSDASPEALLVAEKLIETLEKKLETLRQSARFLTKLKLETRFMSEESDISIVDITRGTFINMNYSITDRGIVLNSESNSRSNTSVG
jgi:hypothetical protein